ncbi:protein SODIUM POTASSIUM ROOT DEFECTIVE 2-like [Oryza brachyantha]|uniref:protein SODIUM POTASSIUM ROOT DEFECTIVE 2-like n=1 Tax=Oryza brachyantha TaxID=4533 RepID=UPI001ADA9B7A|nr:protein SODIUM POTASSIUM ROOT DEFECTIVE 2-like [Oryza brachyantha]
MAPLLFKDMKSLSCSSPASTAICPSLERQPMVRSHKAIAASPLCQVPSEPRTLRQDCRRGQHQHKAVASGVELVSPAGSSRYLLSSRAAAGEEIQEVEASAAPAVDAKVVGEVQAGDVKNTQTQEQVVVLKVSLHCKACAGKVKKHLSKMEGVTSFNIDFAAKKVTVVGDVTPLGVLNSVSKVKNAQFWAATTPAMAA